MSATADPAVDPERRALLRLDGGLLAAQQRGGGRPLRSSTPSLRPMSLVGELGAVPALAISLLAFAFVAFVTTKAEPARAGTARREPPGWHPWRGPWPLIAGGLGLSAVNVATILVAGRPWGVTSAFALKLRSASHLTHDNDQGFIQQSTFLEVVE